MFDAPKSSFPQAGDNHDAPQPPVYAQVPLLGSIPAGPLCEVHEQAETYHVLAHQAAPDVYVLRVTGDSMFPSLIPGDLILVKHIDAVRRIEDFHNAVCAVMLDNEATLKRVQVNRDNGRTWIYLKGDRPDYPTQSFLLGEKDFRILGRVLKVVDRNVM